MPLVPCLRENKLFAVQAWSRTKGWVAGGLLIYTHPSLSCVMKSCYIQSKSLSTQEGKMLSFLVAEQNSEVFNLFCCSGQSQQLKKLLNCYRAKKISSEKFAILACRYWMCAMICFFKIWWITDSWNVWTVQILVLYQTGSSDGQWKHWLVWAGLKAFVP